MKHTKGPWVIKVLTNEVEVRVLLSNRTICYVDFVSINLTEESKQQTLADAKLIAAAPDLLLTLEAILDRSDDTVISQMAKDAISKAKGAI